MRISFLIPSFNHSKYIRHTLDSIYTDAASLDFEIILIDDGSEDDSRSVIDAWCELHPSVDIKVGYRENRGASATANELVQQASGDIIRCCASDDCIFAGSSARIIRKFEESDALVLVGDALVINDAGSIISKSAIELNGGVLDKMQSLDGLKKEIVFNWSIPGPCFAMRKQVYDVVGLYAEDLLIEDWDFFLRVVALCPIQFIDVHFSYYRIHSRNTSRTLNITRKIRNLNAQLTAGKRRAYLFKGSLRWMLEIELFRLILKIIIFRLVNFFMNFKREFVELN